MEDKFYTIESVEKYSSDTAALIDAIKYLYSLSKSDKDYNILTPGMKEALSNAAANCEELANTFKYYSEK